MKIAVTGASGFVGKYFINHLLKNTTYDVVAFSRGNLISSHPRLQTVSCDIYSLLEIEEALAGCDIGIYLIHSMSKSSRLGQGKFNDFDFLLADNFAKAAEKNKLKQILYISGIVDEKNQTSLHLQSRLEVEKTLNKYETPLTTFRCGIVLGDGGSSFMMVKNLVKRLIIIVLPKWTFTKTQVISIHSLVDIMLYSIKNNISGSFDLAGTKSISYANFIKRVSKRMNKKKIFIKFPYIPIGLSKYWVCFVTGYSKDLVYPLVESLIHPMVVDKSRQWPHHKIKDMPPLDDIIDESLNPKDVIKIPIERFTPFNPDNTDLVQSVQRLTRPSNWSINKIIKEYMEWLPVFLYPVIKVVIHDNKVYFKTRFISKPLLILKYSKARTNESRELFYITGGLLAKPNAKARLEFRQGPSETNFIAAIHSFHPRLPWYLYRYTQALIHKWVMKKFGEHLARQ